MGPDAARIVLMYAGFASCWILCSDLLLVALVSDPALREPIGVAKGWLFVVVTAAILYALIQRNARRIQARDSELRAITMQAGDAIFIIDAGRNLAFANPSVQSITGYASGEVIGRNLAELLPAEDAVALPAYLASLHMDVVRRDTWKFIHKDGRVRSAEVTAQRLADGRYLGIARDVTDRLRHEQSAERERSLLRTLVSGIPDPVWLKGADGTFLMCNLAFERLHGVSEAQIYGKRADEVLPMDVARACGDGDLRALASSTPAREDLELTDAETGRRVWMEIIKSRVFDAAGQPGGVLGVARDVTASRVMHRAMQEKLELQATLASITDNAPGVIYSFRRRPDGIMQLPYASPKLAQVTGLDPQALAADASPLWRLVDPQDIPLLDASIGQSAREMSPWIAEFRIQHPQLGVRWISGQSNPEREPDGSIMWRGYLSDVTDRKRGEQAMRESETRYRRLFDGMQNGLMHNRLVFENGVARDMVILSVNPAYERMSGKSRIEGRRVSEVHPDLYANNPGLLEHHAKVASGGEPSAIEVWIAEQDRWLSVSAYCPAPGEVILLIYDITVRKQAEAQAAAYVAQLEKSMTSTVEAVSRMLELRDPYTAGHETRVANLAVAIGRELGMDEHQQTGLRLAGNLHDIGKIAVPAEILSKPGRLTPLEYEVVKTHVMQGYDVLRRVDFSWPVASAVLQHHERLDGSGYPQGLKGEDITREGRILAVADVVEAMSSHRPYRAGKGVEASLREIESGAGTAYDPEVVKACTRLFRERDYALPGDG